MSRRQRNDIARSDRRFSGGDDRAARLPAPSAPPLSPPRPSRPVAARSRLAILTDWPAGGCDPGPWDLILAEKDREVNFRIASRHLDDQPGPVEQRLVRS